MTKQAELREQLDAAYTVLAIQGSPFESEEDTAKIREEASKTIDRLITTHQKQLLEELLSELNGLEVDVEATRKHIESTGLTGDELDNRVMNMELEADDRKDVLNDVSALIEKKLKEQNQ